MSSWQQASIGLDTVLLPKRRQAFVWTDGLLMLIYATRLLGVNNGRIDWGSSAEKGCGLFYQRSAATVNGIIIGLGNACRLFGVNL